MLYMMPCNKYKYIFILSLLLSIRIIEVFGQVPVVKMPQQATVSHAAIVENSNNRNSSPLNIAAFPTVNSSNQQLNMYERDRLEVQHMNMQQKSDEDLGTFSSIQYDLPS